MTHCIGFYVPPHHQLLDLAGPLDAFNAANAASGRQLYRWRALSRAGGQMTSGAGLRVETTRADDDALDTLLVVGGAINAVRRQDEVATVKRVAARSTRIASVCTGAFLLAGAGLLDGRWATTHWSRARELQESFPAVSVEADRIYVADGPVWTSAGITAGIDLALALIEADHGVELARQVSRELVVYHRRPGGQAQFSALSQMEPESDRMRVALAFAREHLSEPLPIERLAAAARLSPRQFCRTFRMETGETPAKAIERLRVEAAYLRLQDGSEPVEVIARAVGFNDPERMRRAFVARYGHPPQAIRRISRLS
ncbi:hypothetical protein HMP09_1952 [Sphingomonas sp. HMP9]|uniref:GlxA family transcriptional regulator n=1 Tax=Sphingomonas sp. HMP9 TaxID=1517554 RepID=UPI00159682AB|nr:GlxA family transcriptional regulator [Sphingomonas sp. HMP9]BCA62718.1 hypothetical protein HMP09_1952 [Sphingomonas sp. HMP9]